MKQERDFIPAKFDSLLSRRQFLVRASAVIGTVVLASEFLTACSTKEQSFESPWAGVLVQGRDHGTLPKSYPKDAAPILPGAIVVWVDSQEQSGIQKSYDVLYVIDGKLAADIVNFYKATLSKNGFRIESSEVFNDHGQGSVLFSDGRGPFNRVKVNPASLQASVATGEIAARLRQAVKKESQLAVSISMIKTDWDKWDKR